MTAFADDVTGIGALAEPVRRALYLYVCAQPEPVGRDQAAEAVGVPVHKAKFHLDRLESDGLLESDFARTSGRTGPGAGRTAKRYRRTAREIAVSLPEREYALAGELMAAAIAESARTGAPVLETLSRVAAARGRAWGTEALQGTTPPDSGAVALEIAVRTLSEHGYEPRTEDEVTVMANCPFHALAQEQTELVCGMNHALLDGLTETLAPHRPRASLAPAPGRCCVTLRAAPA